MAATYTEELVRILSEDDFPLDGAVIRPARGPTKPIAVVHVHGAVSRFSSPAVLNVGRGLAEQGYVVVTGNNRGREFGATMRRTSTKEQVLFGTAWERFEEAPRDIAPWIAFTLGLGFRHVGLLGHSRGGTKVAYYQAKRQDPRVLGLILASPGGVSPARRDPAVVALAERLVAEGRGRDLLPWTALDSDTISASAQTFLDLAQLDVFGTATPDVRISQVRCPILAFYGTDEPQIGTAAELEAIRKRATAAPRVETRMIDCADHNYTGHEREVADPITAWLGTLA